MAAHLSLPCGWCGTTNRDELATNCVNCGGPLPAAPTLAGEDPGPPPPPAPRQVPASYRSKVLLWHNPVALVGAIFTVLLCWTGVFVLIGAPMWYFGWKKATDKLLALERGVAAQARLLEVWRDTSLKINGRSPWRVVYEYEVDGVRKEGWTHAWESAHGRREPGECFWVVYLPEQSSVSAPWPPLK